jgi:hypothetical protein
VPATTPMETIMTVIGNMIREMVPENSAKLMAQSLKGILLEIKQKATESSLMLTKTCFKILKKVRASLQMVVYMGKQFYISLLDK